MRGIDLWTRENDELHALLHPARAFDHPQDVVRDPDLTLNEKRAILASWASDACAVEAVPALRRAPGADRPVPVDDVLDALRALDRASRDADPADSGPRGTRRGRRAGSPDGNSQPVL
jgi:hypothetical protein